MSPVPDTDRLLTLAHSRPADAMAQADRLLTGRPDPGSASVAHQARAIVLRDTGRTREAITELRTALRLARAARVPERVLDVQGTLGLTLGLSGRTAAGLAVLDAAATGSAGRQAGRALARRAMLLAVLGRHADALADLRRAIALLRRGGDTVWEARSRTHRFLVYAALGQAARADRDLAVAERQFAAEGQELESAMLVHNRADVAFQAGDLPAALGFLDQAAARYAALGVPMPQLDLDRCAVLLAAGLATEALAEADEAVARYARLGGQQIRTAELLFAAAGAAQAAGQHEAAIRRATAARNLFRAQHREWWRARASLVLAQARYGAGERGGRLRAQAGRIADRLDALGAEEALAAHLLAGRLAAGQGRAAEADRHLELAARSRRRGPAFGRAAGWLAQALRAEARGATGATLLACRRGLDAAREHQRTLGAAELRAHATGYGAELAAIGQRHAVRRSDGRMLLLWSERWRASALAVPPARPPDDRELAADLAALRDVMRRLDAARAEEAPTARLEQDRRRLEAAVRSRTRRTAGGPAITRRGSAVGGLDPEAVAAGRAGAGELLAALGEHRLVELVTLDGTLYAVTAADRRVRLHRVGPVADAVRELTFVRFALRRLAYGRPAPGALESLYAAGARLERALLGPAAAVLGRPGGGRPGGGRGGGRGRGPEGEAPIVVVPPGRLHAVPWALLPALSAAPVSVAPSLATWLRARRARPPRRRRVALVLGPGLSGTDAEIGRIGAAYADAVVLGNGRATAERALAALDGAWTGHVAAHGTFQPENPLFSALRLDDGPLTVYDLGRLRRAPFRLVLSSCESAVAAPVGADELLGMASALVPLGTASLLASVVPVNDGVTAPLMTAFHDRLRAGAGFADALLAARAAGPDDPVAVATALSFIALGA